MFTKRQEGAKTYRIGGESEAVIEIDENGYLMIQEESPKAYNYDRASGVYTYAEDSRLDPKMTIEVGKNVYSLPGHATFKKPPEAKEGYGIHYNLEKKEWEYRAVPVIVEESPKEPTREEKLRERIWELEAYLEGTTQEVLEDLENGRKVKDEIRIKRQEAREEIRKLDRELEEQEETDGSQPMENGEI